MKPPRISSRFGPRSAPVNGASTIHKGVDLAATKGSLIYAPYDGIVAQPPVGADQGGKAGNYLVIKHTLPDGTIVFTRYLHLMDKPNFNAGDIISKGQEIARVGNTGIGSGPHLHYEERLGIQDKNGNYLPKNSIPSNPDNDYFGFSSGHYRGAACFVPEILTGW